MASHIAIGHDESGEVHIYEFATAHQASEFVRQAESLADISWVQYEMNRLSVREALESIKKYNEPTALEKAQRYATGECLADYYEDYTYEEVCKMLNDHSLNQDEDGDTIVFPSEALEDADVVAVMEMIVNAYLEGAK